MQGVSDIKVGMLDSGTTFTYFPTSLFQTFIEYFQWFCSVDPVNHCKGALKTTSKDSTSICFAYDANKFPQGPKQYFLSYPVFHFKVNGHDLPWYPSEYLYRERKGDYCLTVEKYSRHDEIMMGGTFMR